jgi:hypothetical protein
MSSDVSRPQPAAIAQSAGGRPLASSAISLSRWRGEDVAFNNLVHAGMRIDLSALEPGTFLELHPCSPSAKEENPGAAGAKTVLCLDGVVGMLGIENGEQWIRALTNVPLDRNTEAAERAWLLATAAALLPAPLRQLFNTIRLSQTLPHAEKLHRACLILRTTDHVLTTHGYATEQLWQRLFAGQVLGARPSTAGCCGLPCAEPSSHTKGFGWRHHSAGASFF